MSSKCNEDTPEDKALKLTEETKFGPELSGLLSDQSQTTYPSPVPGREGVTFRQKLIKDELYRKKFVIFLSLCYSFLVLGLNIGQFGPTLLDLQKITRCTLDQASFFFNAHTIGYLLSSIATGILFERFNKLLQMVVPTFVLSIVVAAIPWCSMYQVMVTIHFCKGFCLGFVDAVANAILLHIFAQEVKTYMQILHFMFAFGGIISPVISAPFLSKEGPKSNASHAYSPTFDNSTNTLASTSYITNRTSLSSLNVTERIEQASEVYKAYSIVSGVSLSCAILFIVLYCESNKNLCPTTRDEKDEHLNENMPLKLKIAVLVVLAFIIAFYTAVEDTYAGFLTTFVVKHLKWTKSTGSFVTSVFWTSFAFGRFSGIFIVNFVRQARLLRVYSLLMIGAFICLLFSSFYFFEAGIWIASILAGFSMSIFFPIFFSWTEEKFFHVDGKITALIMTCAMIGVIINPIILGRVMDSDPKWFTYILLVESGLLFLFFSVAVCIARRIKKFRRHLSFQLEINLGENE